MAEPEAESTTEQTTAQSTEQGSGGTGRTTVSIDDPALLEQMVLIQPVCHPETGVILLTKGSLLTRKIISQLGNMGVTAVEAVPYAEEQIAETVGRVQGYLRSIEAIVSVKGQSVNNAAALFQEMQEVKELQRMMQEQMRNVLLHFNEHASETLIQLNNHHPNSAHHSVITGCNAMALARELQWDEKDVLEVTMAAMTHDVGKSRVPLSTLDWPGQLNDSQWQDMHLHTLFGGKLLHQGSLNSASMVALNHHEWYADVENRGYGSLTLFRDIAREELGLDVDLYLSQASPRQLEMIQVSSMADMVAALEEIRSYKGALSPFKVLIIMNSDAVLGHFNPVHYRAWHGLYLRKHRQLLPKGMRFALPREMEQSIEREGRRFIGLSASVRKLSYEELQKMDLLQRLKASYFDLEEIQKSDGILIDRIRHRGVEVNEEKMVALGIQPEKRVKVLLPGVERRLNREDLLRLGVSEKKLSDRRLAKMLEQSRNGLSLPELVKMGIHLSKEQLAEEGERLNKKIFYDMLVMEELGCSRAVVAIVREGDVLDELEKADVYKDLDPLQSYLLHKIGLIEIDFSAWTTQLPDLQHVVRGSFWEARAAG
jgi:hypothetical protein